MSASQPQNSEIISIWGRQAKQKTWHKPDVLLMSGFTTWHENAIRLRFFASHADLILRLFLKFVLEILYEVLTPTKTRSKCRSLEAIGFYSLSLSWKNILTAMIDGRCRGIWFKIVFGLLIYLTNFYFLRFLQFLL